MRGLWDVTVRAMPSMASEEVGSPARPGGHVGSPVRGAAPAMRKSKWEAGQLVCPWLSVGTDSQLFGGVTGYWGCDPPPGMGARVCTHTHTHTHTHTGLVFSPPCSICLILPTPPP